MRVAVKIKCDHVSEELGSQVLGELQSNWFSHSEAGMVFSKAIEEARREEGMGEPQAHLLLAMCG